MIQSDSSGSWLGGEVYVELTPLRRGCRLLCADHLQEGSHIRAPPYNATCFIHRIWGHEYTLAVRCTYYIGSALHAPAGRELVGVEYE